MALLPASSANRFSLMCNESRAEEAMQDAFLAAIKNFSKIRTLSCQQQDAYLVIIVKNKCKDILRRESKFVSEDSAPEPVGADNTYGSVQTGDTVDRVANLIHQMPDRYEEVLQRRLLLGQNNHEVAHSLRISDDTAAKRFERGRKLLAEALEQEGIQIV